MARLTETLQPCYEIPLCHFSGARHFYFQQ